MSRARPAARACEKPQPKLAPHELVGAMDQGQFACLPVPMASAQSSAEIAAAENDELLTPELRWIATGMQGLSFQQFDTRQLNFPRLEGPKAAGNENRSCAYFCPGARMREKCPFSVAA